MIVIPAFGLESEREYKNISFDLQDILANINKNRDGTDITDLNMHLKVKPKIIFTDPSVPRVVAYSVRLQQEGVYRDSELPQQRIAISAARLAQDPLAECCQLWHEDWTQNGFFKLQLHRL